MKTRLVDHLSLGAINASAILTAAFYSQLPDEFPTHFDLHGVPDGFMPRHIGAWLLPGIAFVTWAVMRSGGLFSPETRARLEAPAARITTGLVTTLLAMLHCVALYSALNDNAPVGRELGLVLSLFWIMLGLVTPRLRRNRWVGIRVPWTLASDEVWARTHRFGGAAMVVSGIFALAAVALGHPGAAIAALLASSLVAIIYSAVIAREVPPAR